MKCSESGIVIQFGLDLSHTERDGAGKLGSKNEPPEIPIWPGLQSSSQYTLDPQFGQK